MRPYKISLPSHVLHFSLPEEIAREMTPQQFESRAEPNGVSYFKDGFRVIGGHLHDFNGPFWVGAYGSIKFDILICKRLSEYTDEIASLPGLDRYRRWTIERTGRAADFNYDQYLINGDQWIGRWLDTFGKPPTQADPNSVDLIVFSHPLGEDMFLEIGFRITEWVPGSAKKWKKNADALRETIKATIILEPKKT